jgi:hypothetical protein
VAIHAVHIIIDRETREIIPGLTVGSSLLNLAGLTGSQQLLLEVADDLDIPVDTNDSILIQGGEVFSIGKGTPPIEDNPYLRHGLRVHLNGEKISEVQAFHHAKVTVAQIKALDPNIRPGDVLYADLDGLADELISDTLRIILRPRDKFITVPCGNVGSEDLLEQHLSEVRLYYPQAQLVEEGGLRYLVVPGFELPAQWSHQVVTLLAIVPNGYPLAPMDMFWVDPEVHLAGGTDPNAANCRETRLGKQWQRFSWHYSDPQGAWRPSSSSLLSHLRFCMMRFTNVA